MKLFTTNEAAAKLGITLRTLQRWIAAGKVKAPPVQRVGVLKFRQWTNQDIERVRKQVKKLEGGRNEK